MSESSVVAESASRPAGVSSSTSGVGAAAPGPGGTSGAPRGARLRTSLGVRNAGGVYVWLAIVVVFSLTQPDTFPTMVSVRSVANTYAISGIIALAVIVPLIAGVFDISVGYTMGLAGTLSAWVMANTSLPWWAAVLIGVGSGVGVGLLNAAVVVIGRIEAIIATLATGSIIAAVTTAIS